MYLTEATRSLGADLPEQNESRTHNDDVTTDPNRHAGGMENPDDRDLDYNDATIATDNESGYEESNKDNAVDQDAIAHDNQNLDDISDTELPESGLQEPSYSPLQSTTGRNNDSDSSVQTAGEKQDFTKPTKIDHTEKDDEIVVATTAYPEREVS